MSSKDLAAEFSKYLPITEEPIFVRVLVGVANMAYISADRDVKRARLLLLGMIAELKRDKTEPDKAIFDAMATKHFDFILKELSKP